MKTKPRLRNCHRPKMTEEKAKYSVVILSWILEQKGDIHEKIGEIIIKSIVQVMVKIKKKSLRKEVKERKKEDYYKYIQIFNGKYQCKKEARGASQYNSEKYKPEPNESFRTENYNILTENQIFLTLYLIL